MKDECYWLFASYGPTVNNRGRLRPNTVAVQADEKSRLYIAYRKRRDIQKWGD